MTIDLQALQRTRKLILDSMDLNISKVIDTKTEEALLFEYDTSESTIGLGTPIIIRFSRFIEIDETTSVKIFYKTSSQSAAIGWLPKEATFGKKYPFMYTQCEAALARSIVPCQDTPGAKITVKAILTVEKPFSIVYSGLLDKRVENGDFVTYYYTQSIPIPSYLIAIAAGIIERRTISDRMSVYAEPEIVEAARYEFEDTEQYLQTVIILL